MGHLMGTEGEYYVLCVVGWVLERLMSEAKGLGFESFMAWPLNYVHLPIKEKDSKLLCGTPSVPAKMIHCLADTGF